MFFSVLFFSFYPRLSDCAVYILWRRESETRKKFMKKYRLASIMHYTCGTHFFPSVEQKKTRKDIYNGGESRRICFSEIFQVFRVLMIKVVMFAMLAGMACIRNKFNILAPAIQSYFLISWAFELFPFFVSRWKNWLSVPLSKPESSQKYIYLRISCTGQVAKDNVEKKIAIQKQESPPVST